MDVMFIAKSEELLPSELRAIVHGDGVWDSEAMDDVEEEQHDLLGFYREDRSAFIHFVNLSMVTSKWV